MDEKKLDRKKWLKYIKMYEDFNKEIPENLKELFSDIRQIIGEPSGSFKQSIDLEKLGLGGTMVHIDVSFNYINESGGYEDKNIQYYSQININDLLEGKDNIDIPIVIHDILMNQDKLISVIAHEIRHIYDIFDINEEADMKSFIKSLRYSQISKIEDNKSFKKFLYLVYLSLEHELIARNTMIWEMFMNCNCDKNILYSKFKDSSVYESLDILSTFNYDNLLKQPDIVMRVNRFIDFFDGKKCIDINDVELFLENWNKYFKDKSSEYMKEAYLVLDDLFELIREKYNPNTKPKIMNVKELLLNIHNTYIFPK